MKNNSCLETMRMKSRTKHLAMLVVAFFNKHPTRRPARNKVEGLSMADM